MLPALLTRMSTSSPAVAELTASQSVTSKGTAEAVPPPAVTSAATVSARSGATSLTSTRAPAAARPSTIARPTFWPAPVTRAVRPSRSLGPVTGPSRAAGRSPPGSVDDAEGRLRAGPNRLLDLLAQLLGGLLLEHVEEVVVTHLEDLGRRRHAQRIGLAQVPIHDHSHAAQCNEPEPRVARRRAPDAKRRPGHPGRRLDGAGSAQPSGAGVTQTGEMP